MLPEELEKMLEDIRQEDITLRHLSYSALAQMLMLRGLQASKKEA